MQGPISPDNQRDQISSSQLVVNTFYAIICVPWDLSDNNPIFKRPETEINLFTLNLADLLSTLPRSCGVVVITYR